MLQAVAALVGAFLAGAGCYSLGLYLLTRTGWRDSLHPYEVRPLSFLLGAAAMHLVMFFIFTLHIAYWPVIVAVPLAGIALAWRISVRAGPPPPVPQPVYFLGTIIGLTYFVYYFVNAWAPDGGADSTGYHLGLLGHYLRSRGFESLPTNMYAALGQGIEMVFAPAFAVNRNSAPALTHMLFAMALCWLVYAWGRRSGHATAGFVGAVLLWVTPIFGRDLTYAYIDVGAAAVAFAAFYWIEIWWEKKDAALLIPAGLMLGYAFASKMTASTIGVFALVAILTRPGRLRSLGLYLTPAALMALPWILRSWIWYGNPLAPVANAWFPNPYFHIWSMESWAEYFHLYTLTSIWQIPLELTIYGGVLQGIVGPLFLLLPLALLAWRDPAGRRLLLASLCVLLVYPLNIGTRFVIPVLPFWALALAMVFARSRWIAASALILHAAFSWPDALTAYANASWHIYQFPWKAALRIDSPDGYLKRIHGAYTNAKMVEDYVPRGEQVLVPNGIADAYTTRTIRTSYMSAANINMMDTFDMGWDPTRQLSYALVLSFQAAEVSGVRVVEEQASEGMWGVHELRFLRSGKELARSADWRLRASPNPWDVRYAFDNSPVTRWRTWQKTPAGALLEAVFGGVQTVDQVRLEVAGDYDWTHLHIEFLRDGAWQRVEAKQEAFQTGEPRQVRREVIRELAQQGIHYLMLHPDDYGVTDVLEDPEGWGLVKVAGTREGTLFRSIW